MIGGVIFCVGGGMATVASGGRKVMAHTTLRITGDCDREQKESSQTANSANCRKPKLRNSHDSEKLRYRAEIA